MSHCMPRRLSALAAIAGLLVIAAALAWLGPLVAAGSPGPAHGRQAAQASASLEVVAQEGGASYGVAVDGSVAYLVVGPRIVALDVSVPDHPTVIGRSAPLPWVSASIAAAGGQVYVAAYERGLWALDAGQADLPVLGTLDIVARDVVVDGNRVYVAAGADGLRVFEARPDGPPIAVAAAPTQRWAMEVAAAGGYAFVAMGADGDRWALEVIDVADPAVPQVASLFVHGGVSDLALQDGILYGSDLYGSLHVIDVREPLRPRFVRRVAVRRGPFLGEEPESVAVAGDIAYVGGWAAGDETQGEVRGFVWTVDLSEPEGQEVIGTLMTPYDVVGLSVAESGLLAADLSGGLLVLDVSRPAALRPIGTYDPPGTVLGVAAEGTSLYTASPDGLGVHDIAEPSRPERRSSFPGLELGLWIADGRLFASGQGERGGRVDLYDLASPEAPAKLGTMWPVAPADLAALGGHAFVPANWEAAELGVWDISDPARPSAAAPSGVIASAVEGYAHRLVAIQWVADVARLLVLDTADAPRLRLVGEVVLPGYPWSLAVAGDHAFVSSFGEGIVVVDLTTVSAPRVIGSSQELGEVGEVVTEGPVLYAQAGGGLTMIDIRRPCRLDVMAHVDLSTDQQNTPGRLGLYPGRSGALAARDGLVFAAAKDAGFYVLRATAGDLEPPAGECPAEPTPIPIPTAPPRLERSVHMPWASAAGR